MDYFRALERIRSKGYSEEQIMDAIDPDGNFETPEDACEDEGNEIFIELALKDLLRLSPSRYESFSIKFDNLYKTLMIEDVNGNMESELQSVISYLNTNGSLIVHDEYMREYEITKEEFEEDLADQRKEGASLPLPEMLFTVFSLHSDMHVGSDQRETKEVSLQELYDETNIVNREEMARTDNSGNDLSPNGVEF